MCLECILALTEKNKSNNLKAKDVIVQFTDTILLRLIAID